MLSCAALACGALCMRCKGMKGVAGHDLIQAWCRIKTAFAAAAVVPGGKRADLPIQPHCKAPAAVACH